MKLHAIINDGTEKLAIEQKEQVKNIEQKEKVKINIGGHIHIFTP